jgi:hypothetical protein
VTANELADAIEKGGKDGFFQDEIIAILRQQQNKIEALKLRELTDREIMELYCMTSDNDPLDFARAILQKASEQ